MIRNTSSTKSLKKDDCRGKENRIPFASKSAKDGVISHKPITNASSQISLFTQNKFFHTNGIDPKDIDLIKKFDSENKDYDLYEEFKESDLSKQMQMVNGVKHFYELKEKNEKATIKTNNLKRELEQTNLKIEKTNQKNEKKTQELQQKTQELQQKTQELQQKTQELEQANHKIEFLTQQVQQLKIEALELSQSSSGAPSELT